MSSVGGTAGAQEERIEGNTAAPPEEIKKTSRLDFEKLPDQLQGYDDLVIFCLDLIRGYSCFSELIRVCAIDTADGSVYHVLDIRSSDFQDIDDFNAISVVAYGTKIYAAGGPDGYTWVYDIAGTRKWEDGPKLQAGKRFPVLFTLNRHLYILESGPDTPFKEGFEVLDLEADGEKCWKPLPYSNSVISDLCRGRWVFVVVLDEEANRVYCCIDAFHLFPDSRHVWVVYDVNKNSWDLSDSAARRKERKKAKKKKRKNTNKQYSHLYDDSVDRILMSLGHLTALSASRFCPILDREILLFYPPYWVDYSQHLSTLRAEEDEKYGCADLLWLNLLSDKEQVVGSNGLKCPIELLYQHFEYFYIRLKQHGDICLVSFFYDPGTTCIGELDVYLIKSEEDKNKKISSVLRTSYNGSESRFAPRRLQQLSQLGRASPLCAAVSHGRTMEEV